jgi:hypothetical protein
LKRAVNIAQGADHDWLWGVDPEDPAYARSLGYNLRPSVADAVAYSRYVLDRPLAVVSYDIETDESPSLDEDARDGFADTRIRLVQFATEGAGAIAIPWERGFFDAIGALLRSPNPKCGHNVWLFDDKVLRVAGARDGVDARPRGVIHDTLQMFHHWQPDLPAHLQFAASFVRFPFPWKHLAAGATEFYGCCDVDATLRLYTFLASTLRREGLWGDDLTGYLGQVFTVRPVLAAMEDRGMPIDDEARLALDFEFGMAQRELAKQIDALAPAECCRVHPKQGYKGVPPEVKAWLAEHPMDVAVINDVDFFDDGEENGELGPRYRYGFAVFNVPAIDKDGEPTDTVTPRWFRRYAFNPNSWQQLIAYMKVKGHAVPKSKEEDADGHAKETTAKKDLVRLARLTGDAFYLKIIEYRELAKMRGTYINGFKPGPDGRVHTTFTFDTGIGQLSSRNPNIQNFPKHGRLAKPARRMVAARPGHLITEWDFKSCHVITLGFLAEDLNYMRMGYLDIHSFMTGHVLKLWDGPTIMKESDASLRARFRALKANPAHRHVRDAKVKHALLGIGNGLKARGLYERYPEFFDGQREATRILAMAEEVFPRVFAFQRRIQKIAHEQQYLRTEFGHIRRFYEVFRWDARRNDWGHGDQAEEAIAFTLANIAFGHIREKLKALAAPGPDGSPSLAERYNLFNNVHDSFMFEVPFNLLAQHAADVWPVLVAPSLVLRHPTIAPGGLVIDVEGSAGPHWAAMEEIPLPSPKERVCAAG